MKNPSKKHSLVPIFIVASFFCSPNYSFAEGNNASLTLESAMNMAENYDFTARMASNSQDISQGKADEQLRSMFPNISLSGNYLRYSDQVNKAVGTSVGAQYGLPGTTVSSAGFTLPDD